MLCVRKFGFLRDPAEPTLADRAVRLESKTMRARGTAQAHGSGGESWLRRVSQEPEFSDAEH
ncbi:MAG: hypothetical protein EB018_12175 [Gammaproteobacteria bacterium]|nr:hypothetical protein [Gammaproteobacteria bacterium]